MLCCSLKNKFVTNYLCCYFCLYLLVIILTFIFIQFINCEIQQINEIQPNEFEPLIRSIDPSQIMNSNERADAHVDPFDLETDHYDDLSQIKITPEMRKQIEMDGMWLNDGQMDENIESDDFVMPQTLDDDNDPQLLETASIFSTSNSNSNSNVQFSSRPSTTNIKIQNSFCTNECQHEMKTKLCIQQCLFCFYFDCN
jgi:hypothetical protein